MKGCAYNLVFVKSLSNVYGWDEPGLAYQYTSGASTTSNAFTHAAFKRVAHDPHLQRPSFTFVMGNGTKMVENGFFDSDILPSMLNLATDDPERVRRRDLIAEMIVATAQTPPHGKHFPKFEVPDFINATADATMESVYQVTGYNIFKMAFGIELNLSDLVLIQEWLDIMNPCIVMDVLCPFDKGPKVYEVTYHILNLLKESAVGKAFIAEAAARKMDGLLRLKELTVVFLFAGFGGTSSLSWQTVNHLIHSPLEPYNQEWVKQCYAEPDKVILEGARRFPPVLGINPFVYHTNKDYTLGNGRQISEHVGDWGLMSTNGANHDPAVWGGPSNSLEHAFKWQPGRKNIDKLMTWGNELGALRSCESAAGCSAAPRPCPGAHLSFRLARDVAQHFCGLKLASEAQDAREAGQHTKPEL